MNPLESFLADKRALYQTCFDNLKKEKLQMVAPYEEIGMRLNPDIKTSPFAVNLETADILHYYHALRHLKYLNYYKEKSGKRIYSIDIAELENILIKITDDPRVALFNKADLLSTVDLFYDMRIYYDLLNRMFACYNEKGNYSNFLFCSLSEAINFEDKGISEDKFKDQFKQMTTAGFLNPLKTAIKDQFVDFAKEGFVSEEEQEASFRLFISGDLRKLEKHMFRDFYEFIILKKDLEAGLNKSEVKIGRPTPIKRDLLFDLFPIILPARNFEGKRGVNEKDSKNGNFYAGSFYKYRISTVERIIGK
jgi:hypothetical protein